MRRRKSGGAFVVWQDERNFPTTAEDIYLQRFLDSGAKDPVWPVSGLRLTQSPGSEAYPAVLVDRGGAAIIVWEDRRDGDADLYLHRVAIDGQVGSVVGVGWEYSAPAASIRVVPNPVGDRCRIELASVPAGSPLVEILDVRGRRIRLLLDGSSLRDGVYSVEWDANDDEGRPVAPGVYFVRTTSGRGLGTSRRMVVLP